MHYTCPMHPNIVRDAPGRCPACGMNLASEGTIVKTQDAGLGPITWKNYAPLAAIIGGILLVAVIISLWDYQSGTFSVRNGIACFMAGFFLVFSGFKLIDLKGFAAGYSTYDLIAQKIFAYGYVYPFIELFFGIAMIVDFMNPLLLWTEAIVMAISGIGVSIKLLKKEKFQCVCLGTFLNVPLTTVTLAEDFGMTILALIMIIGI